MDDIIKIGVPLLFIISFIKNSYYGTQGYYQLKKLFCKKEKIKNILKKNNILNNKEKNKLRLILSIREFANNELGLTVRNNYNCIKLNCNYPLYSISACEELSFTAYYWEFPFIGNVNYKGFFEMDDLNLEKKELEKKGFETYIGKIRAYSTLGYFQDCVTKSMLKYSDFNLIDLIIHELVHVTFYCKNNTILNESIATFIAYKGTLLFIEKNYGKEKYEEALDKYNNHKLYRKRMNNLYSILNKIYENKNLSKEDKLLKKKNIYENWIKKYYLKKKINNAYMMQFNTYNNNFEKYEQLLLDFNNDLKKIINHFKLNSCDNVSKSN